MRRTAIQTRSGGELATLQELYTTLDARKRPEDVAQLIVELMGDELGRRERRFLDKAARRSVKRSLLGATSMLEDFARPAGLERQVRTAEALFAKASGLSARDCARPELVEEFLRELCGEIRKTFGRSDYMYDRLNRAVRWEAGLEISRRRYNKLFRHLARMERKLKTLARELKKLEMTKIGKSSLASKLSWDSFAVDRDAACFIAYYTARCSLRSEFTIVGQERAYDQIAAMLLDRAMRVASPNTWAIAHVYPQRAVLARLSEEQRGELLGQWYEILFDIAELLRETWERSSFRKRTMVVRRGDDSTTWNNTASAWNKARGAWMALLYEMGMERALEAMCPGKVLRLMAANVVAWHASAGGTLDPDTQVWNELPLPWQVLSGEVPCGRVVVERVCRRYRVDPERRGWIAPPPSREPVPFRATPELVHGVAVSSPRLAAALRRAGWFSGKTARPVAERVDIAVDDTGFVTGASGQGRG